MTFLTPKEISLIGCVFDRHPEISQVKLFGSRVKGCDSPTSDIDLALWGVTPLQAESIAAELEDLPLPYRFDVKAFESIKQSSLRDHILRRGIEWQNVTPSSSHSGNARLAAFLHS